MKQRAKISDALVDAIKETVEVLMDEYDGTLALVQELKARLDCAVSEGKFTRRTGWNVIEGVNFEACVTGKHIVEFKQPNGRSLLVFWA